MSSPRSRFAHPIHFSTFHDLPSTSTSPTPDSPSSSQQYYLLAQIKENMTITQPTLIVTDRSGVDFALLFDGDEWGGATGSAGPAALTQKGFRKGRTVVVPAARRTDRGGEGKKDVVRVPAGRGGDVKIIPGTLDRILELGVVLDADADADADGTNNPKCAACGKTEGPLMKCTGCGFTAYCGKDCQVKGWSEMDHKSNCKVLKVLREISV